jgi:uncharacterized protein
MALTKQQHLDPDSGPKRILSLDGGGIRGILTLQYLDAIEKMLRARTKNAFLVLSDYFDLIGGTSTGSIIAAGLACGMTVDALKTLYTGIGAKVFQPGFLTKLTPGMLQGVLAPKFPEGPLQDELDRQLGADTTLDSNKILTGLMVMTKRLDTGSPWPLHNNPGARYAKQDGALRLTQIVRASTAAPTYFAPEKIIISARDGSTQTGAFVDGGVSPFNDPALQLLMLAGLQGHGFKWKTGKDNLLIVSVGTGAYKPKKSPDEILASPAAKQGLTALQSLMDDCDRMNRATLQWLTACPTPWLIDSAVGKMELDSEQGPQLATYVRYNTVLDPKWLKETLNDDYSADQVAQIAQMDNPANMIQLAALGQAVAKIQVKDAHLPPTFNLA